MKIIEQQTLSASQKEFVLALWNKEYPSHVAHSSPESLDKYLNTLQHPTYFLVVDETGNLLAWAALFTRESTAWFAMLVDFNAQRSGIGHELLNRMKEKRKCLNAWAVDHFDDVTGGGRTYLSPLPFYLKNGFVICHGQRFPSKELSAVKIKWENTSQD